jgi:hypothetical protein
MTNKITLITPPDIYENSNFSVMFLGMSEAEQETASKWLGTAEDIPECNFYFYQGEPTTEWLFYALNRSDVKYLNLDSDHAIIDIMGSYILGKPNVYYTTQDPNLKELIGYINNKFISNIEEFLEKVFNEQR